MTTVSAAILLCLLELPSFGATFKIRLRRDGIYRITWRELTAAAPLPRSLQSAALAVQSQGTPVPILVQDGGDGLFGPGDRILFIGKHPRGKSSFHDPVTRDSIYWLTTSGERPLRFQEGSSGPEREIPLRIERHREVDRLLVRFRGKAADLWFERKLSFLQKRGVAININLPHLAGPGQGKVLLTIALRGWSTPSLPASIPDHCIDAVLNGHPLGKRCWSGSESHRVSFAPIPSGFFREGNNRLSLAVPERSRPGDPDPIADVSLLNWIGTDYPASRLLASGQARYETEGIEGDLPLASPSPLVALAPSGILPTRVPGGFHLPASVRSLFVATEKSLYRPRSIVSRSFPRLDERTLQADYIVIAPAELIPSVMPLVGFHRARGLSVLVADVEDLYDTFGDGRPHPEAIRAFLSYAYHCYRPPRPRFVLLVGDASWDPRMLSHDDRSYANWTYSERELASPRFNAVPGSPYESRTGRRNLVPTFVYGSLEGHSASDNRYVSVDGDDYKPDMAIGRFPVTRPEEVLAIVEKTIALMTRPPEGPWRTRIDAIADGSAAYVRQSEKIIETVERKGYRCTRLYPQNFPDASTRRRALQRSFDQGALLVHFLGHGGRFIWRTAPADYETQSDLFTLEDVDRLEPNGRLPVVLSMTCYSAPFDHPFLDSIGERLLRTPGRGAAAFIGASWRNVPSPKMSAALLDWLTTPGMAVGEALRLAKGVVANRDIVELYSLLGDPALLPPLPASTVTLTAAEERGAVDGEANMGDSKVTLDWIGDSGNVLETLSLEARGTFHAAFPGPPDEIDSIRGVRALASGRSEEGIGFVPLRKRRILPPSETKSAGYRFRPRQRSKRGHTFHFTTASELENLGFDIYRAPSKSGPFKKITMTPIPGAGTSDEPHRYTFVDSDADPARDCYYYVESISVSGERERFTPIFLIPASKEEKSRETP